MMPDEKSKLLALLEHEGKWCRGAEAHDAAGEPVRYDDCAAVAWDITGALCRLFGWQRACVLFPQIERHIIGGPKRMKWPMPDPSIDAMRELQDFNDRADVTFDELCARINELPVWSGRNIVDDAPSPAD